MAEWQNKAQPAEVQRWREESNSIIVLSVKNEKELFELNNTVLEDFSFTYPFYEPDFCYELTAIAVEPCNEDNRRMFSSLPLAGKNPPPTGALKRERSLRVLADAMSACEQTPGQSVMEHGLAVRDAFRAMWEGHVLGWDTTAWGKWNLPFLPQWLIDALWDRREEIRPYLYEMERYLTVHDCGKPFCEPDGTRKFPDHAAKSAEIWAEHSDDKLILELIANDMWIHTMKAAEIPAMQETGLSLLFILAGFAEINANARMFGGIESESFKIKFKQLDRRGKAMI